MPSRLIVVPARQEISKAGGTAKHRLACVGDQRLAFKVKLKAKFFRAYSITPVLGFIQPGSTRDILITRQITPVLGFIQPGSTRDILITRQPGEVGRDDLLIQYIVAPCGYDPRHAFINGAEIGSVKFKIIIVDGEPQNYPQTAAKGKIISDAGLQWTKKVSSADDEKLEKEIAAIYNARRKTKGLRLDESKSKAAKKDEERTRSRTLSASKSSSSRRSSVSKLTKASKTSKPKYKLISSMGKGNENKSQYYTEKGNEKGAQVKERQGKEASEMANLPSEGDNDDGEERSYKGEGMQKKSKIVSVREKAEEDEWHNRLDKSTATAVQSSPQKLADTQHLSPAELSSSSGAKKVKYKDVDYGPVDEVKHCYGSNAGGAPGCVTADPRDAAPPNSQQNNNGSENRNDPQLGGTSGSCNRDPGTSRTARSRVGKNSTYF
ncbi:hypothetical protein Tcan_12145 [Toxocara canis]|uniref:Major sperm protein n=1 Tax=Toxocara canis TaxID=6265 RepID=A0A0B2USU9_TOXCA|nr:hypothetical protein Tcan_12145 [Toxocara canis]